MFEPGIQIEQVASISIYEKEEGGKPYMSELRRKTTFY